MNKTNTLALVELICQWKKDNQETTGRTNKLYIMMERMYTIDKQEKAE